MSDNRVLLVEKRSVINTGEEFLVIYEEIDGKVIKSTKQVIQN